MHAVRAGVPTSHRDQLPPSSRYELLVKIASGGMATVYVGRLTSAAGVTRLVAVKRAHAHLLEHPAFARMVIGEARLASRIHHPNVVAVQDVEEIEGELLLVMDYVEGASLSELLPSAEHGGAMPIEVAMRVILDACAGLHAAHELTGDDGTPLGIVHRDVSPHNILVGIDGVARLTDFGIAKSSSHTQSDGRTSTGALKGKVSYMAPEYIESGRLDARSDVFSLGVVAWETLTGRRLFRGETDIESLRMVLAAEVPQLASVSAALGPSVNAIIRRALARDPTERIATAAMFGEALEAAALRDGTRVGKHADVAAWMKDIAGSALEARRALVRRGGGGPSSARATKPMRLETPTTLDVRAREGETAPALFPEAAVTAPASVREIEERPRRSRAPIWAAMGVAALAVVGVIVAIPFVSAKPRSSMAATMTSATLPSAVASELQSAPPAPPPPSVNVAPPPMSSAPRSEPKIRRPAVGRPLRSATPTAAQQPPPPPPEPQDKAPPNPYGR
jgi:eukaryotic-like serine/threonine-protein kinase